VVNNFSDLVLGLGFGLLHSYRHSEGRFSSIADRRLFGEL